MNFSIKTSVLTRLHAVFEKSLQRRCMELECILKEYSPKDLHCCLTLIIESIFGFGGVESATSWCIGDVSPNIAECDKQRVRHLLAPEGPLLLVIYKLAADTNCKYEFPISNLPYPTQCQINDGNIPAFYRDKIQLSPTGKPLPFLQLGAFEFYMCQFAYYLISNKSQNQKFNATNKYWCDSLYPMLLEDYLAYFFNIDSSFVHFSTPAHMTSDVTRQKSLSSASVLSSPYSGLLLLGQDVSGLVPPAVQTANIAELNVPPTWRAESLLQILVEFYLNHYSDGDTCNPLTVAFNKSNESHMCAVRIVIKHLHYFVNSCQLMLSSPSHRLQQVSPWDDFKRRLWPQFVQQKLYVFLRHHFDYWPLDSMFRLVLETWLSFIQPWRYCVESYAAAEQSMPESGTDVNQVDFKWLPFVIDNLLFYTVLCRHFLQRALRMDLSSSKNAYMLFRVSKVFGLSGLAELISEAECSVNDTMSVGSHVGRHPPPRLGYNHNTVSAIINAQIVQLEGVHFNFQPLFGLATERLVVELLEYISEAIDAVSLSAVNTSNKTSSSSWFAWLTGSSIDYNTSQYGNCMSYESFNDVGVGSRAAAETYRHLEQAANNLCKLFQVYQPVSKLADYSSQSFHNKVDSSSPDIRSIDGVPTLTPLGRYQMMNGLRKFDINYSGDTDLQPIRSFESTVLVRLFYAICCVINTRFSSEIESAYKRQDFIGRLFRQLVHQPSVDCQRHSTIIGGQHKAQISLRWLANYTTLVYLLVVYLLLFLWRGTSLPAYCLLLAVVGLVYCLVRAIVVPSDVD